MATQFIYQPHIHADGMVITPDLPLGFLAMLLPDGLFRVPVKRMATDQGAQAVNLDSTLHAALAIVAASEGAIVAPALVVLPGPALTLPARAAAAEVLVSRQCWRLKHVAGSLIAEMPGSAMGPVDAEASIRSVGGEELMLPYGRALVVAAPSAVLLTAGRHVANLRANGMSLSHAVDIDVLAAAA